MQGQTSVHACYRLSTYVTILEHLNVELADTLYVHDMALQQMMQGQCSSMLSGSSKEHRSSCRHLQQMMQGQRLYIQVEVLPGHIC